jgi:hypothetical protein
VVLYFHTFCVDSCVDSYMICFQTWSFTGKDFGEGKAWVGWVWWPTTYCGVSGTETALYMAFQVTSLVSVFFSLDWCISCASHQCRVCAHDCKSLWLSGLLWVLFWDLNFKYGELLSIYLQKYDSSTQGLYICLGVVLISCEGASDVIFFLFGVMGVFDWSITKTNTHPIDNPK